MRDAEEHQRKVLQAFRGWLAGCAREERHKPGRARGDRVVLRPVAPRGGRERRVLGLQFRRRYDLPKPNRRHTLLSNGSTSPQRSPSGQRGRRRGFRDSAVRVAGQAPRKASGGTPRLHVIRDGPSLGHARAVGRGDPGFSHGTGPGPLGARDRSSRSARPHLWRDTPRSRRSLDEAAKARGVAPSAVVKTIVVRLADDDYRFVLVPGDREIAWRKRARCSA